ncbi:hypothetical protein VSS74_13145 [Conexibacter stalactiti]|uniref:Uncharacterized protein n=1 Tax=Conexibacter stalactiti TaxID=1940611 RepID=A0ABU4HRA4_9ACTN|nr:hypothetical protein [Conexibacter stalactiti]MDW5595289.1 hypothetical protein [Conexibacter stalactiti]MEC5035931.1 hypothetical protein [Conexibacter stalactiti]
MHPIADLVTNARRSSLARRQEQHERIGVGQFRARDRFRVPVDLVADAAQGFGAAIEFEEQVQRVAVGEDEDAVAVGRGDAVEQALRGALAVPLAQRAAGRARLDGEPHEELVHVEAVGERRGAGDLERVAAAPEELVAVAAQLGGDDAGADLVEHPVERRRAFASSACRSEPVEHPQSVQPLQPAP